MADTETTSTGTTSTAKKFLDYEGLKTFAAKVKSYALKTDGSNYVSSLTLVAPTISSKWTIKKQNGEEADISPMTDNFIKLENGAKVDYEGSFKYPTPGSTQKAPASCKSSLWGNTLPKPGVNSETKTKTDITSDATFSVTLSSPKSGLEVVNGKVVAATGNDTTSDTAAVYFLHRRYWGVSASDSADAETIKKMSSDLVNSRGTGNSWITFDCSSSDGVLKYFYYAYPKDLGEAKWNVGGFDVTFKKDNGTLTEKDIINEYGLSVRYYVYRSENALSDSGIKAIIS